MDFVDQYFETFREVLTGPTEFFESEERRDGLGYSLKFAAVNVIVSSLITSGIVAVFGASAVGLDVLSLGGAAVAAAVLAVMAPVLGFIALFISAGFIHIFVYLLGGEEGYSETLSVVEYSTAVSPITSLISWIPFLGGLASFALSVYAIFIQVKGLESFQQLSTERALAAVLLPVIILVVVIGGLAILAAVAGFFLIGA